MRFSRIVVILLAVALAAAACSSGVPDQPAADRSVGADGPDWDADQTVQRTILIENGMDDGLTRDQAVCMVDAALAAEFALDDLRGIDLSAMTTSGAGPSLSEALSLALIDCGPSLQGPLGRDIPGAQSVPSDTHGAQRDCVINAYRDAWADAYEGRFAGIVVDDAEPTEVDVGDAVVGIIAGCEAGGGVMIGASNEGHLDTFALNTLEWTCLDVQLEPDQFLPAYPFPEEPGNALDRMGDTVESMVVYCQEWASTQEIAPPTAES